MATFTKKVSFSAYNAYNIQGYGISSATWRGWNGEKYNGQYGFAGTRSNHTLYYAFVYRFNTPAWSGTLNKISFTFNLKRETTAAATVAVSLTRTDPTTITAYSSAAASPGTDSGRVDMTTVEVNSGDNQYFVEFNTANLAKNTTYYLVLSTYNTGAAATNYATVSTLNFSGEITYEAEASGISIPSSGYIGSTVLINVTDDGLLHDIWAEFKTQRISIARTSAAAVAWTPSMSLLSEIPSDTSAVCTIHCTTDAGETSADITLYVPENIRPTITAKSILPINTNATVSSWGVYLQGYTKLMAMLIASANYSTIKSWRIDCGAVAFTGDTDSVVLDVEQTSEVLAVAGTFNVTATVTDARGRTATATEFATFTVQPYAAPSVTNAAIFRCNAQGQRDDREGTYISAKADAVFSRIGTNACVMKLQYKERTAPDSDYVTVNMTSGQALIIGEGNTFNVLKSYNVRIYVQDSLNGAYYSVILSTQSVAFNLKPSADSGAAFGGYAQDDKILDLMNGWKIRIETDEHIILTDGRTLRQLIAEGGGGGGGGTATDYNILFNRPSINGVILSGNKTTADLGITIPAIPTALSFFTDDLGDNPLHSHSQYATTDYVNEMLGDIEELLEAML